MPHMMHLRNDTYQHGISSTIGVLLVNLGTPDAPTPKAIRRYLSEFLSDPRVVEMPRILWWCILHGIVLLFRPQKLAKLYQKIWTAEGSPLRIILQRQQVALQAWFSEKGFKNVHVKAAMSYGNPSMDVALEAFRAVSLQQLIVLPLYPQYASSTTGSIFETVTLKMRHWRYIPSLHFVNGYADAPRYIEALVDTIRAHWKNMHRKAHLVFSFHGIPEHMWLSGDPYYCLCQKTARLVAEALLLTPLDYSVVFQSRLGCGSWLKPYCDEWLKELPKQGITTIDMIAPGFSADCLETLEELAMRHRGVFLKAGGIEADYIPALNDKTAHIDFLGHLLCQYMKNPII